MIFSKNFNFNGKWQTVELTEDEIERLRKKHMKNLLDLFEECDKLVNSNKLDYNSQMVSSLFDKLALQFYSVILAELDQRIYDITHREAKIIERLNDEKHNFDEEVGEKYK